jgi:DNA invertase Pin-like site-specific DNA recombinase
MSPAGADGLIRATQYLRMSSDNQRYSTENQQNAIAEYAQQHGYQVIASYIDAGKSGLSLNGRHALRQLLSDALAAQRPFDTILVLDVSRWGRFQNPDQAAHYEFLCWQAGVRVVYCGEPFGEDVAPITTIVKHLKRVMASEYSRDLSAKVCRAKRQQAQLGFRQGGKLAIARRLAGEGIKGYGDKPLSRASIRTILSNELCIGRMTYNRTLKRLQSPATKNRGHDLRPSSRSCRSPSFKRRKLVLPIAGIKRRSRLACGICSPSRDIFRRN